MTANAAAGYHAQLNLRPVDRSGSRATMPKVAAMPARKTQPLSKFWMVSNMLTSARVAMVPAGISAHQLSGLSAYTAKKAAEIPPRMIRPLIHSAAPGATVSRMIAAPMPRSVTPGITAHQRLRSW